MKKLVVSLMLALSVLGGTVAVVAGTSTHVAACPQGSSNC
jgi:hypothetical protein